ncbi:MAG: hypothetical protein R3F49_07245 [Planctomycetota bacterium]
MLHLTLTTLAALAASGVNAALPQKAQGGATAPPAAAPAPQSQDTAAELTRALARWELDAATSGDDVAVRAAIEDLATRAAAAALAAPLDPALAECAAAISEARLRFRRERGLERAPNAQLAGLPQDNGQSEEEIIEEAVARLLQANDLAAISSFGALAVPTLERRALALGASTVTGYEARSLDFLATQDKQRAFEVIAALSIQPSPLVRRELARVLETRNLAGEGSFWRIDDAGNGEPLRAEWAAALERLATDPGVAPKDLRLTATECVLHGYAPRWVIDVFMGSSVDQWPVLSAVPGGARPLFVAGLAHADEQVRQLCVRTIAATLDPTPAFALYDDPSSAVRSQVAQSLGMRRVRERDDRGVESARDVPAVPSREWRRAFDALLLDPHPKTAEYALNAVYLTWSKERRQLVPPLDLIQLAGQVSSAELTRAINQMIPWYAPESIPLAIEAAFGDVKLRADRSAFEQCIQKLARSVDDAGHFQAAAGALLRALRADNTREAWAAAYGFTDGGGRYGPESRAWIAALGAADAIECLRAYARLLPWVGHDMGKLSEAGELRVSAELAGAARAVVMDADASLWERYCALRWSLEGATIDAAHLSAVIEVVGAAMSKCVTHEEVRSDAMPGAPVLPFDRIEQEVQALERSLVKCGAAPLTLKRALFQDVSVPDEVMQQLRIVKNFGSDEARAEAARAALIRFPVSEWARAASGLPLMADIVDVAPVLTPRERIPLLSACLERISAADAVYSSLATQTIDSIAESRDPELLVAMRAVALAPGTNDLMRMKFAVAASSFLTEDAAKLILDLAEVTSNSEQRAQILVALDQVVAYQTSKARWAQRNDAAAVRSNAIAELTALLDDPAQPEALHVEALRGLGLLGAVEELPRLVRALNAPQKPLQAAAREALERLHARDAK